MKRTLLIIVWAGAIFWTPFPAVPEEAPRPNADAQKTHVVTGILQELDLTRMKGLLKTDLGKPIFFEVTKPELFKNRSVGERVSIQLDEQGRAAKVIDVPVAELGTKELEKPGP
ncbi:MAG: hypothetical protein ACT4OO_11855 [Nitrospiraceae bacterium]